MTTSTLPHEPRTIAQLNYALLALSLFVPVLSGVVAVALAYHERQRCPEPWLTTHFDWQIRTFWWSLLGFVLGLPLLLFLGLGLLIWLLVFVWVVVRLVIGFLRLNECRAITHEELRTMFG
jgi:uncharacterized membrane protein